MKRLSVPARRAGLLMGLPLLAAAPLPAQQTVEGVEVRSAVQLTIGGRVQTQFNTTTVDGEPDSELFIRRARLELEAKVNDLVSGRIQPDFAGDRVSLKDVYLKLTFSPGLQVLAGKAYKPFSLLEQTSSTRILPIERGARIRGIDALDEYTLVNELDYSDRDIGLQLMGAPAGAPLGFAYAAGVFQGPLHRQVGENDSYQFAARATVEPLEDLTLGAGWSSRDFASRVTDPVPGYELERGNAFEIDVEYGSFDPGFHLLGEVALGDINPFVGGDFFGAQAWLAYRTGEVGPLAAVEPIFRASYGDVDPSGDLDSALGGTLLTPGLNLYFGGRNRVMFNYDFWSPGDEGDSEASFKAMFQLAF